MKTNQRRGEKVEVEESLPPPPSTSFTRYFLLLPLLEREKESDPVQIYSEWAQSRERLPHRDTF